MFRCRADTPPYPTLIHTQKHTSMAATAYPRHKHGSYSLTQHRLQSLCQHPRSNVVALHWGGLACPRFCPLPRPLDRRRLCHTTLQLSRHHLQLDQRVGLGASQA